MYLHSILVLVFVLSTSVRCARLGDMTPAYVLAGRNARGSCSDQNVADLRIAFGEAIKAVKQAVQAFDNLRGPRPAAYHPKTRRTWDRQAQLLKALFNINVEKSHPLTPDNEDANVVQGKRRVVLPSTELEI